jgi:hypothetical protein
VLRAWMASDNGSGGGGNKLERPTWNDLDSDDSTGIERIGTDADSPLYTAGFGTAFPAAQQITTHLETAVRVNRNNHWSASSLAAAIAGTKEQDPISVVGRLVGAYWARRLQRMVLATLAGVLADNDAAPAGTEHVQGDLTLDISGGGFVNGVTNFSADAVYDALLTLGDAENQITGMAVHSIVHNRMRKNGLLDFRPDQDAPRQINTYFNDIRVVVDDGMPRTGFVCDTYLFGPGFLQYATVPPENATTSVWRDEAGNGMGSKELWNRVQWCVHPMGHRFMGTPPVTGGGPSNAATANNLAHADSWVRSAQSRKHIPFVRLRTREA